MIVPLEPSRMDAFRALFDACASPCYCRYWHFEGDKNAWLARCAFEKETSLAEQARDVASEATRGLLAMEGERAIGWMKVAPRASLPKLRKQSVYRRLDLGIDAGVFSIGCFLVHPEHRKRGVARRLIEAADGFVRAWGGTAIEAYPRRFEGELPDEQAFMGPESLFAGYEILHGDGPYPVMRKTLSG
jgi:GNAT superfamily N-acetyltransferase